MVRAIGLVLLAAVLVSSGVGAKRGGKPQQPPDHTRLGERKLLAILVNFQDKQTEPYTAADVESLLFSGSASVNRFYQENSHGLTWVTGDVTGWHTMPVNVADCSGAVIQQYAEAAAGQAGYAVSNYQHVFYVFDFSSECLAAGLTGGGTSTIGATNGVYSYAWIHLSELKFRILAHEFGHGLGLLHSRPMDCGDLIFCDNSPWDSGDAMDIMGGMDYMHVNAFYKEILGWSNQTTVTQDGAYTILPVVSSGLGPRALKILKSTDKFTKIRTFYYVEFHQPVGFEDGVAVPDINPWFPEQSNYFDGLTIRIGTELDKASSWLLDLTPNSHPEDAFLDIIDGALLVGQTFADPITGLSITAQAVSPAGATVSVDVPGRR